MTVEGAGLSIACASMSTTKLASEHRPDLRSARCLRTEHHLVCHVLSSIVRTVNERHAAGLQIRPDGNGPLRVQLRHLEIGLENLDAAILVRNAADATGNREAVDTGGQFAVFYV